MESYGLRKVEKFEISEEFKITRTKNSSKVVGKIIPTENEKRIGNKKYKIYKCNYYTEKSIEIIADGTPYSEFQVNNSFDLYYSKSEKLLFAKASLTICTPFLKYLMASNEDEVEYQTINFDFVKIVRNNALVDQVWFGTKDVHARTKGFNGQRVNKNKEAMKAIKDGKATYIKVQIDVASNGANKKRTIGFSKKSGIVVVNSNDIKIDTEDKQLQLFMDIYKTYGLFK